jgi:hypothetical protein
MLFDKYAIGWGKARKSVEASSPSGDNKSPVTFPYGNGSDCAFTPWNSKATKHPTIIIMNAFGNMVFHSMINECFVGGYAKRKGCPGLWLLWQYSALGSLGKCRNSLRSDNETSLSFFYTDATFDKLAAIVRETIDRGI